MLLDIPAVASTEGSVANLTWDSARRYGVDNLLIPGLVVSGTFTDNEDLAQGSNNPVGTIQGAGQASPQNYLMIDDLALFTFSETTTLIGQTSSAIFLPNGRPYIPPNTFIYIDTPYGKPHFLPQSNQAYHYGGVDSVLGHYITIEREYHPAQGATIKRVYCVSPTFTVPAWAKSWTLRNVSAADMFYRRYAPNVEGNVIDTTSATFGEDYIVGQLVKTQEGVSFGEGDFTPGSSYMLCAAIAATDGAIVEFHP